METAKPVFQTYEEFAKGLNSQNMQIRQRAELLLALRHHFVRWSYLDTERKGWFTSDDLTSCQEAEGTYDYLSRPAAVLYRVFGQIRMNLRTRILRENKLLPLYKAREFNSRSIIWLSRRPGRTIRQKLSGTKSIMAVERRLTVDTTENRLFKALSKRFLALLLLKEEALGTDRLPAFESELIGMMISFLHSEECEEIGTWTNPPPNNALLSDRCYHAAWTVWTSLRALNGQLTADQAAIGSRLHTAFWMYLLSVLGRRFRLPQQPIRYHLDSEDDCLLFSLCRSHFSAMRQTESLFFIENDGRIGLAYGAQYQKQMILSFSKSSTDVTVRMEKESSHIHAAATFEQQLNELWQKFWPEAAPVEEKEIDPRLPAVYGQQAVFDLYLPNPCVTIDGTRSHLRKRLLLQYSPADENQEAQIFSLAVSRAAFLDEEWPIDSAADLIETADDRPENVLLLQQMFAEVREQVRADDLVMLCPDHCNDFELKPARHLAKLQYFHVRTMPRTLDSVFRLMEQPEGKNISSGDALVFLDIVQESKLVTGISVTVVEARYDSGLEKKVPASRGLIFEHHPSCIVQVPLYHLSTDEQDVLARLGIDFLLNAADGLQLYDAEDNLVDLKKLQSKLRSRQDVTQPVREALRKSKLIEKASRLHFIPLAENLRVNASSISSKSDMIFLSNQKEGEGIAVFDAWTKQAGIAIWRDYLPNIAIKRLIGQFDLVKDSTFEYGFLKEKDITIPGARFLLPKGQAEYHFQLEMSNVSEHMTYEAVVRHKAFPLSEDTRCLLQMKYTYDADIPYSLDFIPLDKKKSGFTIAHVEWRRLKKFPTENLRYMEFPPSARWYDLMHHVDSRYQQEENILEFLSNILEKATDEPSEYELLGIAKPSYCRKPFLYLEARDSYGKRQLFQVTRERLRGSEQKQIYDDVDQNGLKGINDNIFLNEWLKKNVRHRQEIDLSGYKWSRSGVISYNGDETPIIVLKRNFIFQNRIPENPGRISCSTNIKPDKGFAFANEILDADEPLFQLDRLYLDQAKARTGSLIDVLEYGSGKIRFALHSIYGGGRSLAEKDCPEKYQHMLTMFAEMLEAYEAYCRIDERYRDDEDISRDMMNIFSLLNADAGHEFYEMLDEWTMLRLEDTGRIPFWVGFAFGDCTTSEEQQLLEHLAKQDNPDFVGVLARAVWRYPSFIYQAPRKILFKYLSKAISIIAESSRYSRGVQAGAYEYILAMFRLRKLKDEETDEKLSLNNPEMRKLYKCLETMIRSYDHELVALTTRIQLQVVRSEEYDKYADVPDFIYALLVCLTGTQDNSSIVITSIEEGEDDD